MAKQAMKASSLKHLLIFLIVIVIIGGGVGSFFAINVVKQRATEVVHSQIDARVSEGSAGHLNELQAYLTANNGLIDFTNQYLAGTNNTQSQDTIIATLNAIGKKAGVTVQNFDFSASAAAPASPTAAPTSSGLAFTATIKSPLSYTAFLRFLQGIEKTAPRLQITSAGITPDPQDPSTVTLTPITMRVLQ